MTSNQQKVADQIRDLYIYLKGNPDIANDIGAIGRIEAHVKETNGKVAEVMREQERLRFDYKYICKEQSRLVGRMFSQMPTWMQIICIIWVAGSITGIGASISYLL